MTALSLLEETLEKNLDRYPVAVPSALDTEVRDLCRGEKPLRALLPRLDVETLARILDGVIWLESPLAPVVKPKVGSPRTLVLAIDPEDGFVAMGGYLMNHRDLADCLYVVLRNPSDDLGLQTSGDSALLRHDEAALAARIAGVQPLWVNASTPGEGHLSRGHLPSILYDLIRHYDATDVFLPAPLGKDPDRAGLFEAVMRIYAGGYFKGTHFHAYEPLPGAERHIEIDDFLSTTENRYIRLHPWLEPISATLEVKRQVAQWMQRAPDTNRDQEVVKVAGRAGSLLEDGTEYAERFWTFQLTFGRS